LCGSGSLGSLLLQPQFERRLSLVSSYSTARLPDCPARDAMSSSSAATSGPRPEAAAAAKAPASATLFDRLGGEEAVRLIIDDFYARLTRDRVMAPFFTTTTTTVKKKQNSSSAEEEAGNDEHSNDGDDEDEDRELNLRRLKNHQVRFFRIAFGDGLDDIEQDSLSAFVLMQHKRLFQQAGLNERHFDLFMTHLGASMQDAGIKQSLIDEVALTIIHLRPYFQHANEYLEKEEALTLEKAQHQKKYKKKRSLLALMRPILSRMASSTISHTSNSTNPQLN